MRREVAAVVPLAGFYWHPDLRLQFLRLLHDKRLPVSIAKFIFNVLSVFYSEPMYVPPTSPLICPSPACAGIVFLSVLGVVPVYPTYVGPCEMAMESVSAVLNAQERYWGGNSHIL